MFNQQTQKLSLKSKNHHHLSPHIHVEIPHPPSNPSLSNSQGTDLTVSILPLQSARIVTLGEKKKRISSEVKFIHLNPQLRQLSPVGSSKAKKIKNVVYRSKIDRVISQEKTRLAALEETMMFERGRRFNKLDYIKKVQRTPSPFGGKDPQQKKFKRTEDKKLEEQKKFKRVKEPPSESAEERKMIQAKLIKKMREELVAQNISRIPEQWSQHIESVMEEKLPSQAKMFSESLKQSVLELEEGMPVDSNKSFEDGGTEGKGLESL